MSFDGRKNLIEISNEDLEHLAAELNSDTSNHSSPRYSKDSGEGSWKIIVEDYKIKELAALKLQHSIRSWLVRRRYRIARRAVVRIQKWYRKYLSKNKKAEERRKKLERELDDIEFAQKIKYNLSLVEIPEEPSNCYTEMDESECKRETTCEETGSRILEELYANDNEVQTELVMNDIDKMSKEVKNMKSQCKSLKESLNKEIQGLRNENKKLKTEIERIKTVSKENKFKNDKSKNYPKINKEVTELKILVGKYEEEIIKLKANLKYTKKALQNRSLPSNDSRDEDNWKETCIVLYSYTYRN
jgi:hypothetical protein